MTFKQWIRDSFGPESRAARASRRGKARRTAKSLHIPRFEFLENRLAMTVFMVSNTDDSGTGSLRAAIQSCATNPGADIIRFTSAVDGETINLSTSRNDNSVRGPSAFLLSNSDTLTIDGQTGLTQGITIARSGTTPFRFFDIYPGVSLTLQSLTLSNGFAQGGDGGNALGRASAGGGSAGLGGAIFNQGSLTILNSTLTGNTAQGGKGGNNSYSGDPADGGGGGGMNGPGGFDGGGPNGGAHGTFTSRDGGGGGPGGGGGGGYGDSITEGDGGPGGFGGGGGGGAGGRTNADFTGAGGNGGFGGGAGGGARTHINDGHFYFYNGVEGFGGGNAGLRGRGSSSGGGGAGMGGAVFNHGGTVVITNSTITGNIATGGAGGTGGHSANGDAAVGLGGGLFSLNGTLTITNSTFSTNVVNQHRATLPDRGILDGGRGIYIIGSGAGATATINNTIIGQNDFTQYDLVVDGNATIDGKANLITNSLGANDLVDTLETFPVLGVLQNNGGLTPTMALPILSPAVNAGISAGARATDQRGTKRDVVPDIGAYEVHVLLNMVVNTEVDEIAVNDTLSLREAINLANGTLVFSALSGAELHQLTLAESANAITFASSLNGKTITLSIAGDSRVGPSAFLVNGPVTITGPSGNSGIGLAVAGGTTMRLFDVNSDGNLTLQNLTLSGGSAQGFAGGDAKEGGAGGGSAGLGGAIFNQGSLTILNSTLTGNTARGGAGGSYKPTPNLASGAGGAGLNGAGGPPSVLDLSGLPNFYFGGNGGGPDGGLGGLSGFSDDKLIGADGGFGGGGGGGVGIGDASGAAGGAGGFGGGGGGGGFVLGRGGPGGFGGGGGAAIGYGATAGIGGYGGGRGGFGDSNYGGGGAAGMGGAVFNEAGTVVITNSTFTLNKAIAGSAGGAFAISGKGLGGGLFNHNGTITVADSTFSSNTAADGGRGIFQLGDSLFMTSSGYDANAIIFNTIIGQSDTLVEDFTGKTNGVGRIATLASGNLIRTQTGFFAAGIVSTDDPKLGSLEKNGGPTPTMALLPGSPAIDQGANIGPPTDQRGFSQVGVRDIGAFEVNPPQPQSIDFAALANKTYGDADFALSATTTSGTPVSYTVTGNASVYQDVGDVWYVHILGAGSATITAHQSGNDIFLAAQDVAQSFTVSKANATVVVTPYSVIYDGVAHTSTVTSIVGVNGETGATVGTVDLTGTKHTSAGTYAHDFWSFTGSANYNDIGNTTITDTITLALSALQNWTVNRPYRPDVTAAGLPAPITFTLASGTLPTGLTLNANGTFSGSPTATGVFTFTIQATKDAIASGSRTYTVSINAAPIIGALTVTQWTRRHSGFTGTMTIGRGTPAFSIVGKPTGVPPGLTAVISGNTIRFSGAPSTAGTFEGRITIQDAAGAQVSRKFTIKINSALTFTPVKLVGYESGKSYSQTIKTAGGTGTRTVSYKLSAPLPSGLTISPPSPTTGAITISGKTNVRTNITIAMTLTDAVGAQTTKIYTLKWVQLTL